MHPSIRQWKDEPTPMANEMELGGWSTRGEAYWHTASRRATATSRKTTGQQHSCYEFTSCIDENSRTTRRGRPSSFGPLVLGSYILLLCRSLYGGVVL